MIESIKEEDGKTMILKSAAVGPSCVHIEKFKHKIIIESTPNFKENFFYKLWKKL